MDDSFLTTGLAPVGTPAVQLAAVKAISALLTDAEAAILVVIDKLKAVQAQTDKALDQAGAPNKPPAGQPLRLVSPVARGLAYEAIGAAGATLSKTLDLHILLENVRRDAGMPDPRSKGAGGIVPLDGGGGK
jgi:hypothetical protein